MIGESHPQEAMQRVALFMTHPKMHQVHMQVMTRHDVLPYLPKCIVTRFRIVAGMRLGLPAAEDSLRQCDFALSSRDMRRCTTDRINALLVTGMEGTC